MLLGNLELPEKHRVFRTEPALNPVKTQKTGNYAQPLPQTHQGLHQGRPTRKSV